MKKILILVTLVVVSTFLSTAVSAQAPQASCFVNASFASGVNMDLLSVETQFYGSDQASLQNLFPATLEVVSSANNTMYDNFILFSDCTERSAVLPACSANLTQNTLLFNIPAVQASYTLMVTTASGEKCDLAIDYTPTSDNTNVQAQCSEVTDANPWCSSKPILGNVICVNDISFPGMIDEEIIYCCPSNSVYSAAAGKCVDMLIGADEDLSKNFLDETNPLKRFGSSETENISNPGQLLSRFLTFFAFPIAGLILFVMLVWGGFEILAQSATKKSIDAGKQRITNALVGFFLLFASYWIAQLIEVIFGITIL